MLQSVIIFHFLHDRLVILISFTFSFRHRSRRHIIFLATTIKTWWNGVGGFMVGWLSLTTECTQELCALLRYTFCSSVLLLLNWVVLKATVCENAMGHGKMNVYTRTLSFHHPPLNDSRITLVTFPRETFAPVHTTEYHNCRSHFSHNVDIFIGFNVFGASSVFCTKTILYEKMNLVFDGI